MTISSSAERSPHHLSLSLGTLLANPPYLVLALSMATMLLLAYLLIFLQSTTFTVFFISNSAVYNAASLVLTILIALLGGAAVSQAVYIFTLHQSSRGQGGGGCGVWPRAFPYRDDKRAWRLSYRSCALACRTNIVVLSLLRQR